MSPSHDRYPKSLINPQAAKRAGKLAIGTDYEKNTVSLLAEAAAVARPVPCEEIGTRPNTVYLSGSDLTGTWTKNGNFRTLHGIVFAGDQAFGLVAEHGKTNRDNSRFILTKIGEGQKSGTEVTSVEFSPIHTEAQAKSQNNFISVGRGTGNTVIIDDDPALSRNHFSMRVTSTSVDMFDAKSLNGTQCITNLDLGGDVKPAIANLFDELNRNPALWSGEYNGITVIPQV